MINGVSLFLAPALTIFSGAYAGEKIVQTALGRLFRMQESSTRDVASLSLGFTSASILVKKLLTTAGKGYLFKDALRLMTLFYACAKLAEFGLTPLPPSPRRGRLSLRNHAAAAA